MIAALLFLQMISASEPSQEIPSSWEFSYNPGDRLVMVEVIDLLAHERAVLYFRLLPPGTSLPADGIVCNASQLGYEGEDEPTGTLRMVFPFDQIRGACRQPS